MQQPTIKAKNGKHQMKGLQKLTQSESKIIELMQKERLTQADLKGLTNEERQELGNCLAKQINNSTGYERDELISRIDDITPTDTRYQIWERNHTQITRAMSNHMAEYARMPNKIELAEQTKLSRQTIYKHLHDYSTHALYTEEIKAYRFMADKVLAKVFQLAMRGELRACRLYFEVMNMVGQQPGNQNNYIQINQYKLSQETIKQLSSEQLNKLEDFLKSLEVVKDTSFRN